MKYRKFKNKINFIFISISLLLIGTGFSSWIIGEGGATLSDSLTVNSSVGNFIGLSKYISLNNFKGDNNTGINGFKYNPDYGFVYNESFCNIASIKYYISLSTDGLYEVSDYKEYTISLELSYKNYQEEFILLDQYNLSGSVIFMYTIGDGKTYFDSNLKSLNHNETFSSTNHSILASCEIVLNEINPEKKKFINFEVEFIFTINDSNSMNNILQNEMPNANYVLRAMIDGR